ncbi:GNAT family N-acetyltransferase [Bacillus sp. JCM 19041]|uniref:GNAT family N-acetyltransferase n=1 Tax=Bacillus sp. JCM 19041 TaxID=1460637 RepID=UPI0006D2B9FF
MIIRTIEPKDNLSIKSLIRRSLESLKLDREGTAYTDPQLGSLAEYYASIDQASYWVAEQDGEVVGGIGIAPFDKKKEICELQKLYLHPKVQGQGFSKKLMEVALTFASHHYSHCYLETHHSLTTASSLYERFGFKLLPEPISGSEHSAMDAWYLKKLT